MVPNSQSQGLPTYSEESVVASSMKVEVTPTGPISTGNIVWRFARGVGSALKTGLSYSPYLIPIIGVTGAAPMDAADMYMGLQAENANTKLKTRITFLSLASSASVFLIEALENFPQTMQAIKNTPFKQWFYPTKAKIGTVFLTALSYFADLTETDFFIGSLPKEEEKFPTLSTTQLNALIISMAILVMINTTFTESVDTYKFFTGKKDENEETRRGEQKKSLDKWIALFSAIVGGTFGFFNAVQDALKSLVSMSNYFTNRGLRSVGLLAGMMGIGVFKMISRFLFMGILGINTIKNTLHYLVDAIQKRKFEPLKLLTGAVALYMSYLLAINDRQLEEDFGHDITKEIGDILEKNLDDPTYTGPAFYYLSWLLFAQNMIISSGGYFHVLTLGEKVLGMAAAKFDDVTGNKISTTTNWMMQGLSAGCARLRSENGTNEERQSLIPKNLTVHDEDVRLSDNEPDITTLSEREHVRVKMDNTPSSKQLPNVEDIKQAANNSQPSQYGHFSNRNNYAMLGNPNNQPINDTQPNEPEKNYGVFCC